MRSAVIIFFLFVLSGCAFNPAGQPGAWLKPGVRILLPAPGISPAFHDKQLLTAEAKGESHSLMVLLSADDQQLRLAGISTLGVRLFLLTYDKQGIHVEKSLPIPGLPPVEQVLADVMLSYWPIDRWLPLLPQGWTLAEDAQGRTLRDERQQVVSTIVYAADANRQPVLITNFIFNYTIHISHLEG